MGRDFFYELVGKYLDGNASETEKQLVEQYYETLSGEPSIPFSSEEKSAIRDEIYAKINSYNSLRRLPLWRRLPYRVAAACVLLIAVGAATYFQFKNNDKTPILANLPRKERFKNDVVPGHAGAVLTLSGGQKVFLDTASDGTLALQGKTSILKKDSTLSYIGNNTELNILYNTVTTGKGRAFHLQLEDGTSVWLDAMSSIHFPTSFPGKERVVEISGQAYFEVAKDPVRPFRVRSGNQMVQVLGTHFNVNAFSLEVKTTLLEGSVKVVSGKNEKTISPGQQARAGNGNIQVIAGVDLEEILAWKDERFGFNGTSIEDIMSEVSRWYDVEVVYDSKVSERFVAKIPRNVPLSRLLELLEMTRQVAFTIDGKKITVYNIKQKK